MSRRIWLPEKNFQDIYEEISGDYDINVIGTQGEYEGLVHDPKSVDETDYDALEVRFSGNSVTYMPAMSFFNVEVSSDSGSKVEIVEKLMDEFGISYR